GWVLLIVGPLLVIAAFGLISWGIVRWVRVNVVADAFVAVAIVVFGAWVWVFQTAWMCQPLAGSGVGYAQLCTARLYRDGAGGVIRDRSAAGYWFRQAAEQGLAEAEYEVGQATRERAEKRRWLTRAADQGNAQAAFALYRLDRSVAYLRMAADKRYAAAQYHLGVLHRSGSLEVERDFGRTATLWQRAADGGSVAAMQQLAIATAQDGVLFEADAQASLRWEERARAAPLDPGSSQLEAFLAINFERVLSEARARQGRAEQGDGEASYEIGRLIEREASQEPLDHLLLSVLLSRAHAWIERAAQTGHVQAQYATAGRYLDGGDLEQGRRWLSAAADRGHLPALRRVIDALKDGEHGYEIDLYAARDYGDQLLVALEQAGVARTRLLSDRWRHQDTIKRIALTEARHAPLEVMTLEAAEGGAEAQYHLAKEYAHGLERRSFEEWLALLDASAHGGYAQAQYEMASRIRHGPRTVEEERQAIEWIESAVAQGHRGAMVDLAAIYIRGIPRQNLERDYDRARALLESSIAGLDGDIVYSQKTGSGRSWHYSRRTVDNWMAQIP
ncbi:MAG: hypothetical protein O7H39_13590, partial [Gammaproteobacteria bacterium]|nr:hypothetical protein [Gammaproteobacteria bacterium]